jgi:hypothetical protein
VLISAVSGRELPSFHGSARPSERASIRVMCHLPRLDVRARGPAGLSGWDLRRYGLVWISEALLGHEGVTAGVSGVPVVRISTQLFVELRVFVQLVPVPLAPHVPYGITEPILGNLEGVMHGSSAFALGLWGVLLEE